MAFSSSCSAPVNRALSTSFTEIHGTSIGNHEVTSQTCRFKRINLEHSIQNKPSFGMLFYTSTLLLVAWEKRLPSWNITTPVNHTKNCMPMSHRWLWIQSSILLVNQNHVKSIPTIHCVLTAGKTNQLQRPHQRPFGKVNCQHVHLGFMNYGHPQTIGFPIDHSQIWMIFIFLGFPILGKTIRFSLGKMSA